MALTALPLVLVADSGAGMSAQAILCLDPARSILWKTVPGSSGTVSLDWPYSAVRAVLTVRDRDRNLATLSCEDRSATELALPLALPESLQDERVLSLRLEWYDGNGRLIDWATQMAKVGWVCHGTDSCGTVADSFGPFVRTAVVPIPEGASELAVDGVRQDFGCAPTWFQISPAQGGAHVVTLATEAGDPLSAALDFYFPGCMLILR